MIELGSSDAPVLMGCSPHSTPWRLYAEKVGLLKREDEASEVMEWGTRLQDAVLTWFADAHRFVILKEQATMYHADKPWCRATPDGLLLAYYDVGDREDAVLVEIKCVVYQVPPVPRVDWLVQCLHQRIVAESLMPVRSQWLVAFGGLRTEVWEVPRHERAMDRVLREEERFLERIERQDPPPVRGDDASVLHRAWPFSRPETKILDATLHMWVAHWDKARAAMKTWEAQETQAVAHLKTALGESEQGVFPDGSRISWKTTKNGQRRFRRITKGEDET